MVFMRKAFCCIDLRRCTIVLGILNFVLASLMLLFLLLGLIDWADLDYDQAFDHEPGSHELSEEALNITIKDPLIDSEAMERLQKMSPSLTLFLVCTDFVSLALQVISAISLLVGAVKRIPCLLLPWVIVDILSTSGELGFSIYLLVSDVYLPIDIAPLLVLPLSIYCWLVVLSYYQELREAEAASATLPLSMSQLERGQDISCSVPYGRMAA